MIDYEIDELKKQELGTKFRLLLEKKYQKQLAKAVDRQSDIEIDFNEMDKFSPLLGELLLEMPVEFFPILEKAIQEELGLPIKMKPRIFNVPNEVKISNIRSKHSGKFIAIEGIVRKASDVRPEIMKRTFHCSKCDDTFEIIALGMAREIRCANCGRAMKAIAQEKLDARWITVEEPFELTEGEKPAQLNCIVSGDISNEINRKMSDVGNRLKMSGVVKEIPREKSTRLEFYFDVNHIRTTEDSWSNLEITKEDETEIKRMASDDEIYKTLSESIAPSIYGMDAIKEAVLLQIFSGVHKDTEDGGHIRGDIHILLLGDPSSGKTSLMKIVSNSMPRAKYVSGTGSSQAGLTATVTKDDKFMGGWVLEAGALVLCNGSLLAVDEFEKMMVEDQVIFHESMESGCYDENTEVLTKRGWKFFKDLDYDDEMATLSEKGELEYQRFARYIKYPYKGEMYHFDSLKINLLVTPNHNMFVNLHKRAGDFHGWGFQRAYSLFGMNGLPKRLKFKRDANWIGEKKEFFILPSILKHKNQNGSIITNEIKYKMDDWLEFFGYFISEGCVQYQNKIPYRVYISQTKNKENIEKIGQCLKRLNFKYSFDGNNFCINNKQLATYLSVFGKARQKHIPNEYKNLSKEHLKILLDAMILGDGYISRKNGRINCGYVTSSKRLADDVQEVALKIGCSATIHPIQPKSCFIRGRKVSPTGLIYNITLCGYLSPKNNGEPNINFQGQKNIIKRNYDGMVYCVEVPNHTLYVRRNGYPVWCGNSVSIAKATIVATLPARTSILAGANPNMSRFDPFLPIVKQVSIPETLLSRFDLKFILKDKPNKEKDMKLLKHIQNVRRNGNSTPKVSNIMLKKYISYAKAKCAPLMTDEAEEKLQEFYLTMRKISETVNVMAITLRQFEALCRLAEASAKVQLSPVVRIKDAEMAIRLMEASLMELGYDPKTKMIDIDRVEGNVPQSERGKTILVLNTIAKLSKEKKDVERGDLIKALSDDGIEWNYEIENVIDKLNRQGMIFQPTPHTYQKL